jgi:hypothetical protein
MVSSRTLGVTSTANGEATAGTANGATSSREALPRGTNDTEEWSQDGPLSLSASVDLHNLVRSTPSDSDRYSVTRDQHHHVAATDKTVKISCQDEEESYEAFGSVEGDLVDDGPESPGGSSSAPSPTGTGSHR